MRNNVLFGLIILCQIVAMAGNKVKGELRTEANGFQWYCYKDREAYTKDGIRLFPHIKAKSIEFIVSESKYDKGCFSVKLSSLDNALYSSDGRVIKGGYSNYNRCYICSPTKYDEITFINIGVKATINADYTYSLRCDLFDDQGRSIVNDIDHESVYTSVADDNSYYQYRTNSSTSGFITTEGHKELEGEWVFTRKSNTIVAKNGNVVRMYSMSGEFLGNVKSTEQEIVAKHTNNLENAKTSTTYEGKEYYITCNNGRYGLKDATGNEIVPAEMEALEPAGAGYLRYKINGFYGVMTFHGKVIIDTNRGYTYIGNYVSFTKRFPYTMSGYKGECDEHGVQISKIKIEQ